MLFQKTCVRVKCGKGGSLENIPDDIVGHQALRLNKLITYIVSKY